MEGVAYLEGRLKSNKYGKRQKNASKGRIF